MQLSNGCSCKVNTDQKNKTDNVDVVDANTAMPDYFRSSKNRVSDKK